MRKRDPFLFQCTLRIIASKGNGAVEAAKQQHRELPPQRRLNFHERREKDFLAVGVILQRYIDGEDAETRWDRDVDGLHPRHSMQTSTAPSGMI